jgi:hypothetical protein
VPALELELELNLGKRHTESLYWATPLTADKLTHFETWKKGAMPVVSGSYTFKGTEYSCGSKGCLMTHDSYRGHHNYGMQFFFASI